jgi:formamidopyrimidine-DNA glycosylase
MPELPEVETIALGLRNGNSDHPPLLGRRILRADLLWRRTLAVPEPEEFNRRIPGQVVTEISRRGKFLLLQLSQDWLVVHLRMSGDLFLEPAGSPMATHHRLVLYLDGDLRLAFNDTRKFGRVWLVDDPQSVYSDLGPEPLNPEMTALDFFSRLNATRRQLKPLLMDQKFLAGLGNIYTDEALHLARLHPNYPANRVSSAQATTLLESIRTVLKTGIRHHGASIDWVYRGGDFQNHFGVYQRTGLPCRACATPIERIIVAQRSTHFCPRCQPLPAVQRLADHPSTRAEEKTRKDD